MLSSFQHPRSSIFLSLEHVTLSFPLFLHSCPLTRSCTHTHRRAHTHANKAARDKHGLKPWWPSVGQKHTLLLKSLLYPQQTKRRLHLHTVPTIRPWPGPFLFARPLLSPLLLTPRLLSFSVGQWGSEVHSLCSHVSMLVHSVRLALFTIDLQRDWPAAFDATAPIQIWMSMGVEAHLHLYVCVGSQLTPEGYVCSGWLASLELSPRSATNQAKTGYSARLWPCWTFPDRGGADWISPPP